MKASLILMVLCFGFAQNLYSQEIKTSLASYDSLKAEILRLNTQVENIQFSLSESKNTLKTGVFIATLGYTVTIIGGQLLGTQPQAGEALLYAGGAIGIGGTIVLVNGFNKLDKRRKPTLKR